MNRYLLAIVTLFLCLNQVYSADLKGYIISAKNKPVKNLKVWRKNTLTSVITGKDGFFSFEDITGNDTITFSVSKNREAIIPVKDFRDIKIIVGKKECRIVSEGEVYDMAYSKKAYIKLDPNVLTAQQIEQIQAKDIYELLKGRIPGVVVNEGAEEIIIRGGNSFELENEPLFIINGREYTNSSDANRSISISSIGKLEVQKDGSMYGSKGANGVIIITLKD